MPVQFGRVELPHCKERRGPAAVLSGNGVAKQLKTEIFTFVRELF
jgi:hypothetical protein